MNRVYLSCIVNHAMYVCIVDVQLHPLLISVVDAVYSAALFPGKLPKRLQKSDYVDPRTGLGRGGTSLPETEP
jgi:hypothetical protein